MKSKQESLLAYNQSKYPAHLHCSIRLSGLLPTKDEREKFNSRYKVFLDSDADNRCIYELKQGTLFYTTEQQQDSRHGAKKATYNRVWSQWHILCH